MKLSTLARLIDKAIDKKPPDVLFDVCGDYYQPYYYLFYLLVQELGTGNAVELGVEQGRGCGSLAAGGMIFNVFGFDHTFREPLRELQSRFPNFTFNQQPSLPAEPSKFNKPIHILHIDTEHSYAMAQEEFKAYQGYLAPGAVVCFDDVHAQNDGVLKYFMSLPYTKVHCDKLHPTTGFGVLIYE